MGRIKRGGGEDGEPDLSPLGWKPYASRALAGTRGHREQDQAGRPPGPGPRYTFPLSAPPQFPVLPQVLSRLQFGCRLIGPTTSMERGLRLYFFSTVAAAFLLSSSALAEVLITPEEAALPNDPDVVAQVRRSADRPPTIEVASPKKGQVATSPLNIKIVFTVHGGEKIKPEGVTITYVKKAPNGPIDLTERMKKYITPEGIDMPAAEVPAGMHDIIIRVQDTGKSFDERLLMLSVRASP